MIENNVYVWYTLFLKDFGLLLFAHLKQRFRIHFVNNEYYYLTTAIYIRIVVFLDDSMDKLTV